MLLVLAGMLTDLALAHGLVGTPRPVRLSLLGVVAFGLLAMLVGFFSLIAAS